MRRLTEAENRFLLDLQGYGPDWIGQKHAIGNRMIDLGLVSSNLAKGRQMRVDLTRSGRAALAQQEKAGAE